MWCCWVSCWSFIPIESMPGLRWMHSSSLSWECISVFTRVYGKCLPIPGYWLFVGLPCGLPCNGFQNSAFYIARHTSCSYFRWHVRGRINVRQSSIFNPHPSSSSLFTLSFHRRSSMFTQGFPSIGTTHWLSSSSLPR